jgi:hypothetical protein
VNIGYPFCPTFAKCLKTLADGDPNGTSESHYSQPLALATCARNAFLPKSER